VKAGRLGAWDEVGLTDLPCLRIWPFDAGFVRKGDGCCDAAFGGNGRFGNVVLASDNVSAKFHESLRYAHDKLCRQTMNRDRI
jgi:hypothetical protein